jgi:hypothetical protein
MFYSFCFPVAFLLPGNGAGGEVRIQRITIERTQRGGNKNWFNDMKYNIFSVFPVVIF